MDFNISPYYDDFKDEKGFYKILFRPGFALQARELNQIQTVLQKQISRFGNHFFAAGDKVVGGDVKVYRVKYARLLSTNPSTANDSAVVYTNIDLIKNHIGEIVTNSSRTISAKIVTATKATSTDEATIYLKYLTQDTQVRTFEENERLEFTDGTIAYVAPKKDIYVRADESIISIGGVGDSLVGEITNGVFFLFDHFVYVNSQIVVLEKYDVNPSCRIGIQVSEKIVTPEADESLYDNALDSNNYAAPGAHRYCILADLSYVGLNEAFPKNFYELARVLNGSLVNETEKTDDTVTKDVLARRTYDESGDYTITDFTYFIKEHRNNYRGQWSHNTNYKQGDVVEITNDKGVTAYYRCINRREGTDGVETGSYSGSTIFTFGDRDYSQVEDNEVIWDRLTESVSNNGVFGTTSSVTDIILTNPGEGYTMPPNVKIAQSPLGEEYTASAYAVLDTSYSRKDYNSGKKTLKLSKLVLTNPGKGYVTPPTVSFGEPDCSDDESTGYKTYLPTAVTKTKIGDHTRMMFSLSKGKAYVRGYEVDKTVNTMIEVPKAREHYRDDGTYVSHTEQTVREYIQPIESDYVLVNDITDGFPRFDKYVTVNFTNGNNVKIATANCTGISRAEHGTNKLYINNLNVVVGHNFSRECSKVTAADGSFSASVTQSTSKTDTGLIKTFSKSAVSASECVYTVQSSNTTFASALSIGNGVSLTTPDGLNVLSGVISEIVNSSTIKMSSTVNSSLNFINGTLSTSNSIIGTIAANGACSVGSQCTITGKYSSFDDGSLMADDLLCVYNGSTYYKFTIISVTGNKTINVKLIETNNGTNSVTSNALVGLNIVHVITSVQSSSGESRVYELQKSAVKSVKDISYTIKEFVKAEQGVSGSVSNGQATFELGYTGSFNNENTNYFTIKRGSTYLKLENISVKASTPTSFTITSSSIASGDIVYGSVSIRRDNTKPATKTLKTYTNDSSVKVYSNDTLKCVGGKVVLTVVDAVNLIKVYDGTTDVTDSFVLVNNANTMYYDYSYLQLKSGYNAPVGNLTVWVEYFTHDKRGTGNYYTANSYTNVPYEGIPTFGSVELANCVDFRQDVTDTSCKGLLDYESSVSCNDITYYLPRYDIICLTSNGTVQDVCGVPSMNPQIPAVPENSMHLYTVLLHPYTNSTDDVEITAVDNKRYTMRDIGRLEDRINTLADYTTMCLLEQETSTMDIVDENGYDRYKQGFVVDNFTRQTNSVRNERVNGYSIDEKNGVLRPAYVTRNVDLKELIYPLHKSSPDTHRANHNYKMWKNKITLPIKNEVKMIELNLGTQTEAIDPFYNIVYSGQVEVSPKSDTWYADPTYSGTVTIDAFDSSYDAFIESLSTTTWGDWNTKWTETLSYAGNNTTVALTGTSSVNRNDNHRVSGRGSSHALWQSTVDNYATYKTTSTDYYDLIQTLDATRSGETTTGRITTAQNFIGEYVTDSHFVGYMRSRNLVVSANGLKPNTSYFVRFDDTPVNEFCVPASKVVVILDGDNTFDDSTVFSDTTSSIRKISAVKNTLRADTSDSISLNRGEEIEFNYTLAGVTTLARAVLSHASGKYLKTINNETKTCVDLYVFNQQVVSGGDKHNAYGDSAIVIGAKVHGVSSNCNGTVYFAEGNNGYSGTNLNYATYCRLSNGNVVSVANSAYSEYKRNFKIESDSTGRLQCLFWIPDPQIVAGAPKFETGVKRLSLCVNEDGSSTWDATTVSTEYSALGIQNTTQGISNTVRSIVTTTTSVNDSFSFTNTIDNYTSETHTKSETVYTGSTTKSWYVNEDPTAQTFKVTNCPSGAFLTKVDVYFASVDPDEDSGVILQIRPVVNGYPSTEYIAESYVQLKRPQIKLSNTTVSYVDNDGETKTVPNFDTPTSFVFSDPVYVENDTDYAIVLIASSNLYRIWISEVGKEIPGYNRVMTEQPYSGSYFKSQNAETWEPEQTQDILFTLYRAEFSTGAIGDATTITGTGTTNTTSKTYGTLIHTLPNVTDVRLVNDPVETFKGSTYLRIWHKNNNLYTAFYNGHFKTVTLKNGAFTSKVTTTSRPSTGVSGVLYYNPNTKISSFWNGSTYVDTNYNGLDYSNVFENPLSVVSVDSESYVVRAYTSGSAPVKSATTNGYTGGTLVTTGQMFEYDLVRPNICGVAFADGGIRHRLQTYDAKTGDDSDVVVSTCDDHRFKSAQRVQSGVVSASDYGELRLYTTFNTANGTVTPVFDKDRASAILVSNTVEHNTESPYTISVNFGTSAQVVPNKWYDIADFYSTANGVSALSEQYRNQEYILSIIQNNSGSSNYEIHYIGSVGQMKSGTPETVNSANVHNVQIDNTALNVNTTIRCRYFKIVVPSGSASGVLNFTMPIESTYETKEISLISDCSYLRINSAVSIPDDTVFEIYYKTYQNGENGNLIPWVKVDSTKMSATCTSGETFFRDFKYSINADSVFNKFVVKLNMRSRNSASVPMVKDLRIIACA